MIKSDREYKEAIRRLERDNNFIRKQKEELRKRKFSDDKIKRALDPILSFHQQLIEEVEAYKQSQHKSGSQNLFQIL